MKYNYFFQILTSVLQEHSAVMLRLCVLTPKDRTSALVNLVIRETEKHVKVKFVFVKTVRYKLNSLLNSTYFAIMTKTVPCNVDIVHNGCLGFKETSMRMYFTCGRKSARGKSVI